MNRFIIAVVLIFVVVGGFVYIWSKSVNPGLKRFISRSVTEDKPSPSASGFEVSPSPNMNLPKSGELPQTGL